MVAKGTNNRHLQQELNTEVSCSAPTLELKEIKVNTLEDISSSNLPSFISSDVVEDIILFVKQIFDQKKIRKSFNNDNQCEVPQKHSLYQITLAFTKTGLVKCKIRECLNYSTYGVCGQTIAVSAYTSSLTFCSRYKKIAIKSICLNFQTLEIQVAQEQRKATKECNKKVFITKEQRKLSQLIEAISPTFLLVLAKCKSLIKFSNQPKVPIGQSL